MHDHPANSPSQEPTILPVPPHPRTKLRSPKWEADQIIIGLILLGILVFLIARFHNYLNLMITAFVVSILLQPLAKLLERLLRIKWRLAVLIVYLLVFGLVIFLIARGGVFILEQARSLVDSLQTSLLPIIEQLSQKPVNIGSFTFTLPKLDTNFLVTMVQERLVPLAGQAPGAVGKTVSVVGGFLFNFFLTFMVSLFITSESEATNGHIFQISIPGYEYDLRRMGRELSNTWNAFIRGEFIVIGTAILISPPCSASWACPTSSSWASSPAGAAGSICGCLGRLAGFRPHRLLHEDQCFRGPAHCLCADCHRDFPLVDSLLDVLRPK